MGVGLKEREKRHFGLADLPNSTSECNLCEQKIGAGWN